MVVTAMDEHCALDHEKESKQDVGNDRMRIPMLLVSDAS